jgi:hypothetical protein
VDEPPEDDETSRRRRRALIVFFSFVLMTAVGIGSLVLLLRGPEDVELARESGLEVPSGSSTVTPTAAVTAASISTSTVSTTASVPPTSSPAFEAADLGGAPAGLGGSAIIGVQVPDTEPGTDGGGDGAPGQTGGGDGSPSTGTGTSTTSSVVTSTGQAFAMSVSVPQALYPGVVVPLDVRFSNPNSEPITLLTLDVEIDGGGPPKCPFEENFTVDQFGDAPSAVVIPGGGATTSLTAMGIPQDDWPRLRMLALDEDQNGCMGVTVTLALSATARGGAA